MCGIFGFIGMSSVRTSLLVEQLCIADAVRGRDSTGLCVHQRPGLAWLVKHAKPGTAFVADGHTAFLFDRQKAGSGYRIVLGHNRAATSGAVTARNAHPFPLPLGGREHDFGVHNGTIGRTKELAKTFGVKGSFEVDSEVALRAVAKLRSGGLDTPGAVERVTEFISADADFAFAYLETAAETVWLWRSPDRPLAAIDATAVGLGWWFCSTPAIFERAWGSIRGFLFPVSKLKAYELSPYRLYRVRWGGGSPSFEPVRELRHNRRVRPAPPPPATGAPAGPVRQGELFAPPAGASSFEAMKQRARERTAAGENWYTSVAARGPVRGLSTGCGRN
mgnify:CR=1 FL=1